jgi:hypothetical protein
MCTLSTANGNIGSPKHVEKPIDVFEVPGMEEEV